MQLEVKNLSYKYNEGLPFETQALSDVSFTMEAGEFVALIGHTGSGKSTLIQHLNGLLKPQSGTVTAGGVCISQKSKDALAMRRKIGLVFQYPEYQLFEESVLKDVCFGPKNLGFTKEEAEEKAKAALRLVGIDPEEKAEVSPFALSGGEKRRVAIAGVLAMDPEILILDEPTAGLDPQGHDEILAMIEDIHKEKNMGIILVSHNMDDVAKLADKVLVMNRGKLVMTGTPAEVFKESEALKEMGLGIPAAKAFLEEMKAAGFDVNTDLITIESAAEEILKILK